jgi:hypothetical protein
MGAPQFTPGPWELCAHLAFPDTDEKCGCGYRGVIFGPHSDKAICQPGHDPAPKEQEGSEPGRYPREVEIANARLIAAAPELYEAAAKHLEWIEKEHSGPDYGGLTRDTHPDGEHIWRRWWNEQLDLCADTERLCRAALTKTRGEP